MDWPKPMERWPYGPVNLIAGVAGGLAFIFIAPFVGGPLNPSRDMLVLASLEVLSLLLANGLALWRNLAIRRIEARAKQYWEARQLRSQK